MSGLIRRTMLNRAEVRVAPGFLLLLAVLFYLDDGTGIMIWTVLAAAVHECGHILMSGAMGGKVRRISLSLTGAELRFAYREPLSYARENCVLLAGPFANLLLGCLLRFFGLHLQAILSVGLGCFNLLPLMPLDGGRILYNIVSERGSIEEAERVLCITGAVILGVLVGVGGITMARFANPTIWIISFWLLAGLLRRKWP